MDKKSEERIECLKLEQYKLAIDARNKLNDDYHRWVSFYYIANGAILVAVTTVNEPWQNFVFTLVGVLVCIIWNLSCKGYYYWSVSWIRVIQRLERNLIKENRELGVYTVFSEKSIIDEEKSSFGIKGANISTPKLTMLTSLFFIIGWGVFGMIQVWKLNKGLQCCQRILISCIIPVVASVFYLFLLKSQIFKSRRDYDIENLKDFRDN